MSGHLRFGIIICTQGNFIVFVQVIRCDEMLRGNQSASQDRLVLHKGKAIFVSAPIVIETRQNVGKLYDGC